MYLRRMCKQVYQITEILIAIIKWRHGGVRVSFIRVNIFGGHYYYPQICGNVCTDPYLLIFE